jgi:ferritin-like metal-binding protein YciE
MAKDLLISWLNDAYAMEQTLLPVLQNHAKDAEEAMPEAAAHIRRHIDETRTHAERIEQCLRQLGTTPSTVKSAMGSMMGTAQSVMTGMFSDEMIKNALGDYGSEQFEVASYTALVAAAEELGETEIARLCEENLREDQLMASWFEQQIPTVVARSIATNTTSSRR